MKKLLFLSAFLLCIFSSFAQSGCPTVTVTGPDEVKETDGLNFTANTRGGDSNVSPTYNWSVSSGVITSGQGTSSITIDASGVGGGTITGTVEIGGYSRECSTTASVTTMITVAPRPVKTVVKKKNGGKKTKVKN